MDRDDSLTQVLLSLGSNQHPQTYLPFAIQQLAGLGSITTSKWVCSPDYTAISIKKSDNAKKYVNFCVLLVLQQTTSLKKLLPLLKKMEKLAHRGRLHDCPYTAEHLDRFARFTHAAQLSAVKTHSAVKVHSTKHQLQQHHFVYQKFVTLDIDILLLQTSQINQANQRSQTNQRRHANHWIAIKKRYPFKPYETVGVIELLGSDVCSAT